MRERRHDTTPPAGAFSAPYSNIRSLPHPTPTFERPYETRRQGLTCGKGGSGVVQGWFGSVFECGCVGGSRGSPRS